MLTPCPHCGQPMPQDEKEMPQTMAFPKVVKVFIRDKNKPVRSVAVVQTVDFYREQSCAS